MYESGLVRNFPLTLRILLDIPSPFLIEAIVQINSNSVMGTTIMSGKSAENQFLSKLIAKSIFGLFKFKPTTKFKKIIIECFTNLVNINICVIDIKYGTCTLSILHFSCFIAYDIPRNFCFILS
jgi:hypothetical protein